MHCVVNKWEFRSALIACQPFIGERHGIDSIAAYLVGDRMYVQAYDGKAAGLVKMWASVTESTGSPIDDCVRLTKQEVKKALAVFTSDKTDPLDAKLAISSEGRQMKFQETGGLMNGKKLTLPIGFASREIANVPELVNPAVLNRVPKRMTVDSALLSKFSAAAKMFGELTIEPPRRAELLVVSCGREFRGVVEIEDEEKDEGRLRRQLEAAETDWGLQLPTAVQLLQPSEPTA